MATSQDDESEWDKSTSEVQSEDSEDLFETRPNRWRGPPQSWRTLTEEDRLTHDALERLRNQDLSLHLYNAFALKHPTRQTHEVSTGENKDAGAETGQPARNKPWAPPKSWTAWPLGAQLVPPDDFMKTTEDEDEVFTFRKVERETPSSKLEEIVSAAVLRCAKEKFRARGLEETRCAEGESEEAGKSVSSSSSSNGSSSSGTESEEDDEATGSDETEDNKARRAKKAERTFKPAIATDDDLSYDLIRPSARAILERLDQTLTLLHNARTTSTENPTGSSRPSPSGDEDFYSEAMPKRRSTSRATSHASTERARSRSISRDAGVASPEKKKSNRGRKAASGPRQGESEREFLIRRAREQKKKRPVFFDEEDGGGVTTAAEGAESPRRRRRSSRRESTTSAGESRAQSKAGRLRLRDWSDVIGAAALAGFSPRVVERATQRCANLFRQGMEMHSIADDGTLKTRRYVPGEDVSSDWPESDAEEEDGDIDVRQARSMSRVTSAAPSRAVSSDEEGRGRAETPRKRQKRSHSSATPGTRPLHCPHADCERATRPFDRPFNLKRHLKKVHGEESDQDGASAAEGGESPAKQPRRSSSRGSAMASHFCPHAGCERAYVGFDRPFNLKRHMQRVHGEGGAISKTEVGGQGEGKSALGDVHRDGFLEPIHVQKGWRAEDTKQRAKSKKSQKRRRDGAINQDVSEPQDDGSSTEPASDS